MNEKTPVTFNLNYPIFLFIVIIISIIIIVFNNILSFRYLLHYAYTLFLIVSLYEFFWQVCKIIQSKCAIYEIKMYARDGTTEEYGIKLDYKKRTFTFCFALILATITLYVRNGA
jgi:hypothetical protein